MLSFIYNKCIVLCIQIAFFQKEWNFCVVEYLIEISSTAPVLLIYRIFLFIGYSYLSDIYGLSPTINASKLCGFYSINITGEGTGFLISIAKGKGSLAVQVISHTGGV